MNSAPNNEIYLEGYFPQWYGIVILNLLSLYYRSEQMNKCNGDKESQFLSVGEGIYKYGKGED